jgi:hypothetical protein
VKTSTRIATVVCIAVLSTGLMTGCMKKAPQLTQAQLMAGVIGDEHPVDQQTATAKGCSCHLSK